ncbi:MAG: cyclase family protein [Acidobacteria bacterium]|nr:cyclase family protein [Acidobacteriota bacterium]
MRRIAQTLCWLVALAGCRSGPTPPAPDTTAGFTSGVIVDLSHPYDERTIFWPTAELFRLQKVADGVTPQGYYYAANQFSMAEHGGTHIDAPIHFAQGKNTVDRIPLAQLIGPSVVIDVSRPCESNPNYQITTADLDEWERAHGRVPAGSIVLLRTGFSRFWPDAGKYLGTAERGEQAVPKLHFPGLEPGAARWLVDNRSPKAVGLDTASIDYGQSKLFETHRVLMDRNVPALENLTNLDRLPASGASVIALPMKIGGGSGGPLRAIAILP